MRTIRMDKYYTSMQHLIDVYDSEPKKLALNAENAAAYAAWKSEARSKLIEISGIGKMMKCDLNPQLLETEQMDGYRRDKMIIQTETDVWMPFYVLVPDSLKIDKKSLCMIAPHGHNIGGKLSTVGRSDIPAIKDQIEVYHSDYGVKFVREGYVTFCPDARGFGERREWTMQKDDEESFLASTCTQLNHMAIGLGRTVTGMWTWDLMRLIDYIESREDCDCNRIGCAGFSGGGLQTLWLTALDERIKCAVISGYYYGYKDSLLKLSNNCSCNYIPHLWENVDLGDIGSLIAPRPLLIESGTDDHLNGERGFMNVTEQVDITRKAYSILGAEDRLYHHVFKGGHRWNGWKTYAFVKESLNSL